MQMKLCNLMAIARIAIITLFNGEKKQSEAHFRRFIIQISE